ncbi:MAG: hypothetical protein QXU32_02070 [Nitrososphaerales archaeon]
MSKSLLWAIYLVVGCVVCMVGFNVLGQAYPELRDDFKKYADYAFDCLKVLFGMIIGVLTEKFHSKKQAEVDALKARLAEENKQ